MADDADKLLELAFKAEKFGDRAEAIRLYRQVAITDPDNATYASNCADELEKLGVATPAPQASIADTDITNPSNPFQTPTTPGVPNIEGDTKYKIIWRSHFTSNILWCLAIFCLLTAALEMLYLIISLRMSEDWSHPNSIMQHILSFLRMIVLLWVAWFCGAYAKTLRRLIPLTEAGIESFTKMQFCLWIGVLLLAALSFVDMMLPELLSYFVWYDITV